MHYTYVHLDFSLSANFTYTCAVNIGVHVACWQLRICMCGILLIMLKIMLMLFTSLLCLKLCWHNVRVPNGQAMMFGRPDTSSCTCLTIHAFWLKLVSLHEATLLGTARHSLVPTPKNVFQPGNEAKIVLAPSAAIH